MALSYPLSMPGTSMFPSVTITPLDVIGHDRSPFTLSDSVHDWGGAMWQADITLRPMAHAEAGAWIAFLTGLRGRLGTFLLGDPYGAAKRGTASSATITGSAGDTSVTVAMSGTLLAGDYLQLGSGSSARLHQIVADRSGSGTMEIWPPLRANQSGATATLSAPKGVFRLASNERSWTINDLAHYGLTFGAQEKLP